MQRHIKHTFRLKWKSIDGVLGTQTQCGGMVDADESTELWPASEVFLYDRICFISWTTHGSRPNVAKRLVAVLSLFCLNGATKMDFWQRVWHDRCWNVWLAEDKKSMSLETSDPFNEAKKDATHVDAMTWRNDVTHVDAMTLRNDVTHVDAITWRTLTQLRDARWHNDVTYVDAITWRNGVMLVDGVTHLHSYITGKYYYKGSTIINYDSRVVETVNFQCITTLESLFTIIQHFFKKLAIPGLFFFIFVFSIQLTLKCSI